MMYAKSAEGCGSGPRTADKKSKRTTTKRSAMNSYDHVFIPVTVSEGMFSSEYRVSLRSADGAEDSIFADRSLVSIDDQGRARLCVQYVKDDEPGICTVLLPQQAHVLGVWMRVKKEDLHPVT